MPRLQTARQARRGYTLTELLIVIIIMITIFAIALPIAKKVMDDSNTREASRQLSAIFQLAKARAAQTGRPFGVWMQCDLPLGVTSTAANPNPLRQVTQLYLAEVPEPFTGAFVDSRVTIDRAQMTAAPQGPWTLIWGDPGTPANYYLGNTGPLSGQILHSLCGQNTPFFIRFNYAGPWFRGIIGPDTGPSSYAALIYGRGGLDGQWGVRGADDDTNGQIDDASEYLSAGSDDLRPPLPQVGVNGVPYQILREPHRSGNPLELPNGTCIDLAYSGTGTTDWSFAGDPDPFSTNDLRSFYGSIVVMFLPAGAIDSIYLVPSTGVNPNTNPGTYGQFNATGSLHFLVGKVQKINPVLDTAGIANFALPEDSNLADATSLWLSIGRLNGAITTSENLPDLGSVTAFSPVGLRSYLQTARQAATGHEQMGGR